LNSPMLLPVLYSFRRCPYAMRARLALLAAEQSVVLREVSLKQKPDAMLAISPKATVPVLALANGQVIEESLQIMQWALAQNDPKKLLSPMGTRKEIMMALIEEADTQFKHHLDRYKYGSRYSPQEVDAHQDAGLQFLHKLDRHLTSTPFLFGDAPSLADIGIFPFVRQFAGVDRAWFDKTAPKTVINWLDGYLNTDVFAQVMHKYQPWTANDPVIVFPAMLPENADEV